MMENPRVFSHYDQLSLDRQYNQQAWAPNAADVVRRYSVESERAREQLGPPLVFAYGPTPPETLDVYPASRGAPIHIHLHGGAWRSLSSADTAYPAPMFVGAGVNFVSVNFALLPQVTMTEMVDQVRKAVAWVFNNAAEAFGGDPQDLHVGGHSSGGHLTGCMLTTDWPALGLPRTILKSGLCLGGMYELEPVRLSSRNEYVRLDHVTTDEFSPMRHLTRLTCPVVVGYSEKESPEFRRQSEVFAAALAGMGRLWAQIEVPDMNHFEGIETISDPTSALAKAALALIKER